MGNFKLCKTKIEDIFIIESTSYTDNRGSFMELYNYRDFEINGVTQKFVQDNISISKKGVLRGLHFQKNNPQGKLIKVLQGEIYDAAVDIRPESKTFGKWIGITLKEHDKRELFIPVGFAHGFLVLSDSASVLYKCTDYYDPTDESGVIWNDPDIGIEWPMDKIDELILSQKDKRWLCLKKMQRMW